MKNNISEELKEVLINFRELSKENKIYLMSILLNHLDNGLINDGNYSSSDEAYENDKLVLEPFNLNLENAMVLATQLLLVGANLENIVIEPNGVDIEPFINEKVKNETKEVLSKFYKLDFKNKIDFLTETIYDIFEIQEVYENIEFDFNGLINELLNYSKIEFNTKNENNLELEITNSQLF